MVTGMTSSSEPKLNGVWRNTSQSARSFDLVHYNYVYYYYHNDLMTNSLLVIPSSYFSPINTNLMMARELRKLLKASFITTSC